MLKYFTILTLFLHLSLTGFSQIQIKLNQIGFYPSGKKVAIVLGTSADFSIVSANKMDTLFSAKLSAAAVWNPSGENVAKADFTDFSTPGKYLLTCGGSYSYPFSIETFVHQKLTKGLIKSFYFNRASMAIVAPWAEKWPRALGHPDNGIIIHTSAATEDLPELSEISSAKGWYDAGDYNKYIVNSGISTYQMLALYEHFPNYFDTLNTFIPESKKGLPDILDEALWNVSWMLTAQDPYDGGVYHKITELNFGGTIMPVDDNAFRYAVAKGTAATLDFAAVMALSARIFSKFESHRTFAQQCLTQSIKAYAWALKNPSIAYSNPRYPNNPGNDVFTGGYGDGNFSDEFVWARLELYITTKDNQYYKASDINSNFGLPNWPSVSTLGLISFLHHKNNITVMGQADTVIAKTKLLNIANPFKNHMASSPYGTPMGLNTYDFVWGSNSTAGNQGMVLMNAYKITGDESYLHAATANLDYVVGRNGTGYSYVTGFGSKQVLRPHHRISEADGVAAPVPGMVVGGPNPGQQDKSSTGAYPSALPAKSFTDVFASYASNEPAINYTSAVMYLAGAVEASMSLKKDGVQGIGTNSNKNKNTQITLYPNPAHDHLNIAHENVQKQSIQIINSIGQTVMAKHLERNQNPSMIDISTLEDGLFMLIINGENSFQSRMFLKN